MRRQDWVLLFIVFASLAFGVLFPGLCAPFQGLPTYALMALFFLSYLPIRMGDIIREIRSAPAVILIFTVMKLIVLPPLVFLMFQAFCPAYAPAALLLSGISTGVVAPFMANLVGANAVLVLVIVVTTSFFVPFTLPVLIHVFLSRTVELSLPEMFRILLLIVFLPVILVELLRKAAPKLLDMIAAKSYPASLTLFAVINLGIFSRYSDFFFQEPRTIFGALVVATALAAVYFLLGVSLFRSRAVEDRLAGAVVFGNMNNVLVIVFSSHFFGPIEPTVAAMYIVPFFGLILPLRLYARRMRGG
ncbi:MAG: hypothetical protein WCY54_01545 [Syntrophales bacterium]